MTYRFLEMLFRLKALNHENGGVFERAQKQRLLLALCANLLPPTTNLVACIQAAQRDETPPSVIGHMILANHSGPGVA